MNVAELKKELEGWPKDMEVMISVGDKTIKIFDIFLVVENPGYIVITTEELPFECND